MCVLLFVDIFFLRQFRPFLFGGERMHHLKRSPDGKTDFFFCSCRLSIISPKVDFACKSTKSIYILSLGSGPFFPLYNADISVFAPGIV